MAKLIVKINIRGKDSNDALRRDIETDLAALAADCIDPGGIDMSRDIEARLNMFSPNAATIEVKRIALTMPQIEEVQPPANPAKTTDGRYAKYEAEYGDESWELDALSPNYIGQLIAAEMEQLIDQDAWADSEAEQQKGRDELKGVSDAWDAAVEHVKTGF